MSDETENTRRASDEQQKVISRLILEENDPKTRGLMIVLQNVNLSLIANTIATQKIQIAVEKHREDFVTHLNNFEAHAMNEEAIMNKGRGMWMVLSIVLLLAQGVSAYGWKESRTEIETMKSQAVEAQLLHEKLVGRITHLEQSK